MNICKGCGYAVTHRQHVAQCIQGADAALRMVTRHATSVTKPVTKPAEVTPTVTPELHGCPVLGCTHGHARTSAERMRSLRERQRTP